MDFAQGIVAAVRAEQDAYPDDRVVVYLDDGATEVVRWAGGLRWAIPAMGLRSPGCLRSLSALSSDDDRCVVVVTTGSLPEVPRKTTVICDSDVKHSNVRKVALNVIAPFQVEHELQVALLLKSRAFPVLPWERSGPQLRGEDLPVAKRQELRRFARDVASLCLQLKLDVRNNVWALGPTAALVGVAARGHLDSGSSNTRGALVLVDRTALVGPEISADPPLLERWLDALKKDTVASTRWSSSSSQGKTKPPMSAVETLNQTRWPAPPSFNDGDRRLARDVFLTSSTADAGLQLLAQQCKARVLSHGAAPAPPKPGRGPGAELLEQLKVLLATAPLAETRSIAPIALAAVDAAQRTRAKKGDLGGALQTRLARDAGAGADELFDVLCDVLDRDVPLSEVKALALALRAVGLCGGPVSQRAAHRLADALSRRRNRLGLDHRHVDADALVTLGSLGRAPTDLADLLTRLLDHQSGLPEGLKPVGGALETFGAAVGNAIGIGRFLGRGQATTLANGPQHPLSSGNDQTLIVFVLGGITPSEIAAANTALTGKKTTAPVVVLASTDLTTPDALASRILGTLVSS